MADYVNRELKTRLVLPFAISAKDRIKAFTKNMEMAAILYLAESNRERGEGLILKKTDEKLVFIAEACYPIWLVPWGGATLLFDGLGVMSHTLSYDTLPDIGAFSSDIQGNTKTCEVYSVALSRNANYFKNFAGKEERTIEGLITSPDFIQDFLVYLSEGEKTKKALTRKAVLSPIIDKSEISASIKDLSDLRAKIVEDAKNLEAAMKLLSTTTREQVKAIREEIKEIRKKFDKEIEKVKPRVTKRKQKIQEKYDEEIIRLSRRFERQLQLLYKNQVRFEKKQKHLRAEINRCEAKRKSCGRRKNKRGEIRWARKIEKIRKTLPTFGKKIKELAKKIEKLEAAQKLEISKKRIECDTRIEETMKTLRGLEASREARIRMKRPEIKSLEETTSLIVNQMNEIAKSKRVALTEFDRMSMPRRKNVYTLVYLPFYFVRYEMESKRRYDIYPPSIVSGMGILTKMKGVFGVTKMKCFLQPRSKAITLFLNQLVTLIQKNPMFEKEATEAGIQESVLQVKKLRIGVKRGLRELENEGWISKNELQTLSKLLFMYTPSAHAHKKIEMNLTVPA